MRRKEDDVTSDESGLLRQEEELQFSGFTNADAIRLGEIIIRIGIDESLPIVVDIHRSGQQLYHCALAGTSIDNDAWVDRKRRVAERFGHSSALVGVRLAASGKSLSERHCIDPQKYSALGGSFPIIVRSVGVVGSVTVSGLTQEEDHELAVRGIREFMKNP